MKIIPAIDLLEGKCVRLHKGSYNKVKIFHDYPVEKALELEAAGFKYLHLVDLDGARNSGTNWNVLEAIVHNTSLIVDFGGGLRSMASIRQALDAGASQVNIGSMAAINPRKFEKCLQEHGDKIVWNADLKNGRIAVNGWMQTVEISLDELIKRFSDNGLKTILSTDVSKDGDLSGPNFELYCELMEKYPHINWIASGGVSKMADLVRLKKDGISGAVIGMALYEGRIKYDELIKLQNAD